MAREWQMKKYRQFVMPDAVYYQSVWAVRDLQRMESRLEELEDAAMLRSRYLVHDQGANYGQSRPTEDQAMEMAVLRERVSAIHEALAEVPAEMRSFILSNLILRTSGASYPNKMWRYWKQRFLYAVAKNLSLI